MANNIIDPKFLPDYTSLLNRAYAVEDVVGGTIPAYTIVSLNASGDLVASSAGTDRHRGVLLRDAIPALDVDANGRFSAYGYYDDYGTVIKLGEAIVKVEPGQAIAINDLITSSANGNGQAGVAGTDNMVGIAEDTSDGSGTALQPHYIRISVVATYVA